MSAETGDMMQKIIAQEFEKMQKSLEGKFQNQPTEISGEMV